MNTDNFLLKRPKVYFETWKPHIIPAEENRHKSTKIRFGRVAMDQSVATSYSTIQTRHFFQNCNLLDLDFSAKNK